MTDREKLEEATELLKKWLEVFTGCGCCKSTEDVHFENKIRGDTEVLTIALGGKV